MKSLELQIQRQRAWETGNQSRWRHWNCDSSFRRVHKSPRPQAETRDESNGRAATSDYVILDAMLQAAIYDLNVA